MLSQVFADLAPFMVVFMLNVYVFCMIDFIMDAEQEDEGKGLGATFKVFLMIFLNSIGGIAGVNLPTWNEEFGSTASVKTTAIIIVWIFWFINVFTMTIVFLNFVIAVVGNTYNEVKTTGTVFIYSTKAEMNFLVQLILNFLGR